MSQWLSGRALRDARQQLAAKMRSYAEEHPCDAERLSDVPVEYWCRIVTSPSRQRTGLEIGFWRSTDGREHLVLRAKHRLPQKRSIRAWRRAFWPDILEKDQEERVEGPQVRFTTKVPVTAGSSEGAPTPLPHCDADCAGAPHTPVGAAGTHKTQARALAGSVSAIMARSMSLLSAAQSHEHTVVLLGSVDKTCRKRGGHRRGRLKAARVRARVPGDTCSSAGRSHGAIDVGSAFRSRHLAAWRGGGVDPEGRGCHQVGIDDRPGGVAGTRTNVLSPREPV